MIFVTVGTHTSGFDRLVRAVDGYAARTDEPVVIQLGSSTYEPRHAQWFRLAAPEEIERLMGEARVIVTHAGAGSVLQALDHRKPLVLVPRLKAHGEHMDDHQLELGEVLARRSGVAVLEDMADLPRIMSEISGTAEPDEDGTRLELVQALREAAASLCSVPVSD